MPEVTGRAQVERKVSLTAAGKRMTIGELRQFLAEIDRADVMSEDTEVQVRTTMSGHLRKIEV